MEKYIWSLDISTTNIGSALWDRNGNLIELKHLALKIDKNVSVADRDIHKAEIFRKYVTEYKEHVQKELNGKIGHVIVEEPLGGSNNPTTAALLFGFNGICRYIMYQIFGTYPMKISVHESRKLFCPELVHTSKRKGKIVETLSFPEKYRKNKKLYIWEKVSKLEPQIDWFYKRGTTDQPNDMCFDMSDSYAVGFAGLKKLGIIK
jgi:hypothetical protein